MDAQRSGLLNYILLMGISVLPDSSEGCLQMASAHAELVVDQVQLLAATGKKMQAKGNHKLKFLQVVFFISEWLRSEMSSQIFCLSALYSSLYMQCSTGVSEGELAQTSAWLWICLDLFILSKWTADLGGSNRDLKQQCSNSASSVSSLLHCKTWQILLPAFRISVWKILSGNSARVAQPLFCIRAELQADNLCSHTNTSFPMCCKYLVV